MIGTPRRGDRSLVGALFLRTAILFVAIFAAVAAIVYWNAAREAHRLHDEDLIQDAGAIRALMREELQKLAEKSAGHLGPLYPLLSDEDLAAIRGYANGLPFWVWRNGYLVEHADNVPDFADPAVIPHSSFSTEPDRRGAQWRVYSLSMPAVHVLIRVAEPMSDRAVLTERDLLTIVAPLTLLTVAGLYLMRMFVNESIGALRRLIAGIGQRAPADLSPIDVQEWPPELQPLLHATNSLLRRIAEDIERESRFVEHAAHQLRTPIAALKLQIQLLSREPDEANRVELASQLGAGVDRAATLVDKLLTLARFGEQASMASHTDVDDEVASVLQETAPLAATRGISLALEGRCGMAAGPALFYRLIVANLIENAVNHAPAESEVLVALGRAGGNIHIAVSDQGPGIPANQRERVFERFYQGRMRGEKAPG